MGQVLFNIKVSRETILDAYLEEDNEAKSEKLIEYMHVTKHSLSQIVGETGFSLLGSRLLQYNYVTRNELLEAFRA